MLIENAGTGRSADSPLFNAGQQLDLEFSQLECKKRNISMDSVV